MSSCIGKEGCLRLPSSYMFRPDKSNITEGLECVWITWSPSKTILINKREVPLKNQYTEWRKSPWSLDVSPRCLQDEVTPAPSCIYRGADKTLARPGRKQATATEDFEFRISYL